MPKKMKKDGDANVHDDLSGFNIKINEFGQMETNLPIDQLNEFLNKNVTDKKLKSTSEEE